MNRVLGAAAFGWLIVLAVVAVAAHAGLRLNVSPSVPQGFYWLSSASPSIGAYVAVCPPQSALFDEAKARGYLSSGRCPGRYGEMIKVLAAGAGTAVSLQADGVRLDGRLWPQSAPRRFDAAHRALPQSFGSEALLREGSVLVMSERCNAGFDGRYFGPLPLTAITSTAEPIWIW